MAQTESLDSLLGLTLSLGLTNSLQFSTRQIVDDTVHHQTPALDGLDDSSILLQSLQTAQNVQLAQPPRLLVALQRIELVGVLHPQRTDGLEPRVEDTELGVGERGRDTAARSVAADNGVLDLEMRNGVLDDGER